MARDYKRRAPSKGKKGASSKKRSRKKVPEWLWLVTGLAVGLLVAALVYVSQQDSSAPPKTTAKAAPEQTKPKEKGEKTRPAEAPKTATPAKPTASAATKAPEPAKPVKEPEKKPLNYDFYTLLPKFEVEVPQDRVAAPPKPATPATTPVAAPDTFVLQVGAFKTARDADARKAELALIGIVSSVQTVTVDTTTYHRVRIGPIREQVELNSMQKKLRENGIEYMLLRERT